MNTVHRGLNLSITPNLIIFIIFTGKTIEEVFFTFDIISEAIHKLDDSNGSNGLGLNLQKPNT